MTETTDRTFEQKLDLLAEVAVKVGLGLQSGQELVMTASLDALPLARRITEQAYRAGASLVTTLYADDEAALMRYRYAPDASFDHAAKWLYDGMGAAFKSGAARLAIAGGNPALLSNEDPGKVGRANSAVSKRSNSSPATPSTGQSSPPPPPPGPPPYSQARLRKPPSPSSGKPSSRPHASTQTTP